MFIEVADLHFIPNFLAVMIVSSLRVEPVGSKRRNATVVGAAVIPPAPITRVAFAKSKVYPSNSGCYFCARFSEFMPHRVNAPTRNRPAALTDIKA
jgi:hypothetical protein